MKNINLILLRTLSIFFRIKIRIILYFGVFLANLKQSKKRIGQDRKRYLRNRSNLSRVKTYIKKFLFFIKSADVTLALSKYPLLVSEIDKSVKKGVFHKNKANRLKSFFSRKIKLISGM